MKLGIFAKTFVGDTPQGVMAASADAGYSTVQYNMACSGIGSLPEEISSSVASAVKQASVDTGVALAAVSATYNMTHPDMAARQAGRRGFAAIAASAQAMGTQLVTVCSGSCDAENQWRHHPDNLSDAAWGEMIREFELLNEIAERHDLLIGVEPEQANIVSTAAKAKSLIDTIGGNRIRIVLDAANLFEAPEAENRRQIIEQSIGILAEYIVMAHAKDRNADGSFATAGKGIIDFDHYLKCLQQSGFDGDLITHGLAADEASEVGAFLSQALTKAV